MQAEVRLNALTDVASAKGAHVRRQLVFFRATPAALEESFNRSRIMVCVEHPPYRIDSLWEAPCNCVGFSLPALAPEAKQEDQRVPVAMPWEEISIIRQILRQVSCLRIRFWQSMGYDCLPLPMPERWSACLRSTTTNTEL